MANLDIKARVRAFPDVGIPVPPSKVAEINAARQAAANEESAKSSREKLQEKSGEWVEFDGGFDFITDPLVPSLEVLDKTMGVLQKIISVLQPVLKIVEIFISSFSSFSTLVTAILGVAKNLVNEWAQDLAGSGVYANFLVPPAFIKNPGGVNIQKLSTGGFQGFLSRLSVSLNNRADPNRPQFSSNASVGAFIILVDSESLDTFYSGMKQLHSLFGSIGGFSAYFEPPPPSNIRTTYGNFVSDEYPEGKNGVKLQWDAPPGFSGLSYYYRLSRSPIQGGAITQKEEIPEDLAGPNGFIRAVQERLSTFFSATKTKNNTFEPTLGSPQESEGGGWPLVTYYEYADPDFNGGSPAVIKADVVNGSAEYIDYDIPIEGEDDDIRPKHLQYYYVIETGWPRLGEWGPRSAEQMVPIETDCINPGSVAVVQHGNGALERLSSGIGKGLGVWSSLQTRYVVPFLPLLIDLLNKMVTGLEGMSKNSNNAFRDFLQGLEDKISRYKQILEVLVAILNQLRKILLGPSISFLYVPPEEGGITKFMTRVRSAEQPDEGFSGPSGITAGMVFMFGAVSKDPFGNTNEDTINEQTKNLEKSFNLIMELLTGD